MKVEPLSVPPELTELIQRVDRSGGGTHKNHAMSVHNSLVKCATTTPDLFKMLMGDGKEEIITSQPSLPPGIVEEMARIRLERPVIHSRHNRMENVDADDDDDEEDDEEEEGERQTNAYLLTQAKRRAMLNGRNDDDDDDDEDDC